MESPSIMIRVAIFALLLAGIIPAQPLHPGWLGQRSCLQNAEADTLMAPPSGWGDRDRLFVEWNGRELLAGQDFHLHQDSVLVLANRLKPMDTLCVWTYSSPYLTGQPWHVHSDQSLPIWDSLMRYRYEKGADADLGFQPGTRSGLGLEATDLDKYRLDFSGSKTMAVTVGDGGGLGLDASLLLDVKGQLAENVFVEGRLSDQNAPLTPEGNTATLKELDTKFIRLYGRQYDATLGDFEFQHGQSGIDAVHARVAGIQGLYTKPGWQLHGALAQSQGVFRSDTLRGVDGKQKGYYLRGKDGQVFIRVMQGTERLWRNGALLERGTDYTIDYSEGRIDFLNRIVVSSENLYAMEFEYAEEEYPRTVVGAGAIDTLGAWRIGIRGIRMAEDEKNPLGLAADSTVRARLAQSGDKPLSDTSLGGVRSPEMRSMEVLELGYGRDSASLIDASLALSQRDANLYSTLDDRDNHGWATHATAKQSFGKPWAAAGFGRFDASWFHDYKSSQYHAFHSWIEPRAFLDLWNLDPETGARGFSANRGVLAYSPERDYRVAGEWGLAQGRNTRDTAALPGLGSESKRMALSAEWGQLQSGDAGARVSTEAKLAKSPLRRDNYRQQFDAALGFGPVKPTLRLDRKEWIEDMPAGGFTHSEQWHPSGNVAWHTPWEPLQLETGGEWIGWRSLFDGKLATLSDSARLLNVDQRIRLGSVGLFSADAFYRFQRHETWVLDASNRVSDQPQSDDFHLFEGNAHWNQYRQGFTANTGYRIQRTAEQPLINDYRLVEKGAGQYVYDSLLNVYHEVETGGDYVLLGLRPDTSFSTRPYQDLQWSADLEIIPASFPFTLKGILADIEIAAQVSSDLQDSSPNPDYLPAFRPADLKEARSGHIRWQPQLRWNHPDGQKHWVFQYLQEFTKTAGFYSGEETRSDVEATGRHTYAEIWEATLIGHWENRDRVGRESLGGRASQESQSLEARLQREWPNGVIAGAGLLWKFTRGQAISGEYRLVGWRPGVRLEKSFLGKGRAFSTYDVQHWSGEGDGDYYALGGYTKGWTHRIETAADFELQTYLFLNLNYLLRFEPHVSAPSQRLNAEIRAVF